MNSITSKNMHIDRKCFLLQIGMERVGAEIHENNNFQKKTSLGFDYRLGKSRNMLCKIVKKLSINVRTCTVHYQKQHNLVLVFKLRADNPLCLGPDHLN